MEEKLITVATHTFERAQLIKNRLEAAGISCYLKNINLIQGAFSGGVKVRILESDKDRALNEIESLNETFYLEKEDHIEEHTELRRILVPIDFSDYSYKAADFALQMGRETKAEITLLHTFFNPVVNTLPFSDAFTYDVNVETKLHEIEEKAIKHMEKLYDKLKARLKEDNEYDSVLHKVILEGIPEDEILEYAKEIKPHIIIMGTRGQAKKQHDLIGSVTAEVIDRAQVPVLAIPEKSPLKSFYDIKEMIYMLNFDQRDFVSFERLLQLLKPYQIHYTCSYYAPQHDDLWDTAKLEGFRDVLQEKFNTKELECRLLEGNDMLVSLEQLIREIKAEMICLTIHKRNIFSRMFNPGIARKMLFHTDTPLLVFHYKRG